MRVIYVAAALLVPSAQGHAESSASANTGRRSNYRKPNLASDHIHTSIPLPDSSPWVRGICSPLAQPHICVLGISRSSRHKRSATGAQRAHYRKKRKFELGRQPANTKLGVKRIHSIRVRGGNVKFRALRLDSGNFAWGSEHVTKKTRIIGVVRTRLFFRILFGSFVAEEEMDAVQVYNASNNELVRTNTLVKGAIIQIDATPFRQWYESHVRIPSCLSNVFFRSLTHRCSSSMPYRSRKKVRRLKQPRIPKSSRRSCQIMPSVS
jgi:ribosomal protein eS8